ncbi:MAG: hypothetical protein ABW223_12265 [Rariglobus sp.]
MKRALLGLLLLTATHQASAISIVIDYSYDTGNFFSSHAGASAALERAALDVSNVITSSLGALSPSTLTYTGTNGETSATVNWSLSFKNPTTDANVALGSFSSGANEYRIFVGARNLAGSTLGLGGSSGAGFSLSGGGDPNEWEGAVAQMQNASNAVMSRGDGPLVGVINGNRALGTSNSSYSLQFGLLAGTLSFNSTTSWHFDHTTAVGEGLFDFYSVALHEILHSVGFGGSFSWEQNHSGTNWLGANGVAAHQGGGVNLLSEGEDHVASGIYSEVFMNGPLQESSVSPSIGAGERRFLTELDVAMLDDLGFSVSAIPEPSTSVFCVIACGSGLMLASRRRRR